MSQALKGKSDPKEAVGTDGGEKIRLAHKRQRFQNRVTCKTSDIF